MSVNLLWCHKSGWVFLLKIKIKMFDSTNTGSSLYRQLCWASTKFTRLFVTPSNFSWHGDREVKTQRACWCSYLKDLGELPVLMFFYILFMCLHLHTCFCCVCMWFSQLTLELLEPEMKALWQVSVCHAVLANGILWNPFMYQIGL